ncbi:methionyl-tRNA formyltransferase [Carnobacteriaceae bacterium zg-ZUI78]|nr:methionyl-tRNA formyltransferase [Carnobacteriaceae bacterium zg-ZUI78]
MSKKIVFMGTPEFSVPILRALVESEYEVIGVVTQPDRLVGRKKVLTPSPVKREALLHGIDVYQPEKLVGSQELETLLSLDIDLIVTAAYGQFLPSVLLNHPTYRAINVHASLLPKYRGGAPVQYAIMNGETQTGVSIMYMEPKMDAGDILNQKAIDILETDTVETLFDSLSLLGRELLIETLPCLFEDTIQPIKQDESKVIFSPNISREQEKINWHQTATDINRQVRAMNSWPGAYTLLHGERFKIWEAIPVQEQTNEPVGTMINITDTEIFVACGEHTVLSLKVVQPSGKSKMSIDDFCRGSGARLEKGDCFEN